MASLTDLIERGIIEPGIPLGALTTYKTGGSARYFAEVGDLATLEELIATGIMVDQPVFILGRGSNIVVSERGFPGLVIRLGGGFTALDFVGTRVTAGGALPLPRLARASAEQGLTGLEFFVGIPGSVGGAVRQNAGCFGSETVDCLVTAKVIDLHTGAVADMTPVDLDLSYRHSNLEAHQLVVSGLFQGEVGDPAKASEKIRVITRWRRDNQPGGTLNAGSVFKNPPGIAAGALIDSLGLKGLSVGGASVSTKHANFFVGGPDVKPEDIFQLAHLVKDRVFESTGTNLEFEVQFIGFET